MTSKVKAIGAWLKEYVVPLAFGKHQKPENKSRTIDVSKFSDEMLYEAIHHGLTQKFGDLTSQITAAMFPDKNARADAIADATDKLVEQWNKGQWNTDASGRGHDPVSVQKYAIVFGFLGVPASAQAARRKAGWENLMVEYTVKKTGIPGLKGDALKNAIAAQEIAVAAKAVKMVELIDA